MSHCTPKHRTLSVTRLAAMAVLVFSTACSRAPITHRVQVNAIPDPLMSSLGASAYGDMLRGSKVQREHPDAKTLKKVGKKISRIARRPDYRWRYALIEDDTINAWCLPGGKIGFYTGILPVLKNEAGMGFVMGHEVGHAIARHGAERITQQATVLGGLTALHLYLDRNSDMPKAAKDMLLGALGLGIEIGVLLPFSRAHEKEADIIGMMFMARAGYPPEESIQVWKRMSQTNGNNGAPTFLSTHPSHKERKKNLREWLPAARKRFERNRSERDTLTPMWTPKG